MTPEGQPFFEAKDLQEIGLLNLPEKTEGLQGIETLEIFIDGTAYLPLKLLSPGVRFEMDTKTGRISLTAEAKHLKKNVLDLKPERPQHITSIYEPAFFLNYGIQSSFSEVFENAAWSLPWRSA